MFIDFTGEKLPVVRNILQITRHKVVGGWYVRAIMTNQGPTAGGQSECAAFVPDPAHAWALEGFLWEKIKNEPIGGIYRGKAGVGWIVFSTAQTRIKNEEGDYYRPRMGSLVFIPDADLAWECKVLEATGTNGVREEDADA